MEDGYGKLREKQNIEKSGVVGDLNLPGGRSGLPEDEEEEDLLSEL